MLPITKDTAIIPKIINVNHFSHFKSLPRNFESVFAVDELARCLHRELVGFMENAFGAYRGIYSAFNLPDILVFGCHPSFIEAWMKYTNRNPLTSYFIGQENRHHVGSSFRHLVERTKVRKTDFCLAVTKVSMVDLHDDRSRPHPDIVHLSNPRTLLEK